MGQGVREADERTGSRKKGTTSSWWTRTRTTARVSLLLLWSGRTLEEGLAGKVGKRERAFPAGQGEVRATGLWTSTRENVLEHESGQRLYETWRSGTDTGSMGAGNLKTEPIYERVAYPRKSHTSQTYYYNMESVQCLKCSRTYLSTRSLQRHQRERHGSGLEFHCRRCSNTYPKRWKLSSHYRDNHQEHVNEAEAIGGLITKEVDRTDTTGKVKRAPREEYTTKK